MEAARELLDLGADVNAENARGSTPLHFAAAAKERTRDICELLLGVGADTGLSDLQGRLPYEMAESDSIRCGLGRWSWRLGRCVGRGGGPPHPSGPHCGTPGGCAAAEGGWHSWFASHFTRAVGLLLPCVCRQLLDGPDPRIFSCSASGDVAGLRQLFQEVRPGGSAGLSL